MSKHEPTDALRDYYDSVMHLDQAHRAQGIDKILEVDGKVVRVGHPPSIRYEKQLDGRLMRVTGAKPKEPKADKIVEVTGGPSGPGEITPA